MKNEKEFLKYFIDICYCDLFLNYSNKNVLNFDEIFIYDYQNIFIKNFISIPSLSLVELGLDVKLDWESEIRNIKLDLLIYKILGITDEL